MSKTLKKIVFFGNERLSSSTAPSKTPTLKTLIEDGPAVGFEVIAVIVSQKRQTGRRSRELEVARVAEAAGIPVVYAQDMNALREHLLTLNADIGVLAAFGRIVPDSIIDVFPKGIINVHPSALPELRGSTPIESAMLRDDPRTGVSVMQLVAEMDAGPVWSFSDYEIDPNKSKAEITDEMAEIGAAMVLQDLQHIFDENSPFSSREQDHSLATFSPQLHKEDGEIDWALPAKQLLKVLRAYADFPGSKTQFDSLLVTVLEAREITNSDLKNTAKDGSATLAGMPFRISKSRLGVLCGLDATGAQTAIEITRLQPAGKQAMDAAGFLAGYGSIIDSLSN